MKFLKGAVIFLLGAGVGGAGSYIYFKKQYDEKKSEINELREHYMSKFDDEINQKVTETIIKKEGYVTYNKLEDREIKDLIKEREVIAIEQESPSEDYPSEPIVITEEDYSERELYFDKLEVDYYLDDGALVDESEDLMVIEDSIGYENLEKFLNDEAEDIMYVRNAKNNADYLVRKVSGSYSDTVGIGGDAIDE